MLHHLFNCSFTQIHKEHDSLGETWEQTQKAGTRVNKCRAALRGQLHSQSVSFLPHNDSVESVPRVTNKLHFLLRHTEEHSILFNNCSFEAKICGFDVLRTIESIYICVWVLFKTTIEIYL